MVRSSLTLSIVFFLNGVAKANLIANYSSGDQQQYQFGDCIPLRLNGFYLSSTELKKDAQCSVYPNDVCLGQLHTLPKQFPAGTLLAKDLLTQTMNDGDAVIASFICNTV